MEASRLRTPLLVDGVYVIVVGILLLFPSLASSVFAYPTKDAAVASGWGAALITLALLAFVAASDVAKYGGLAWVFVAGLLLSVLDLAYYWYTGAYGARQVLAPVVINLVLAAWIWTARPKRA